MKTALITGSEGFVGPHLADLLRKTGHRVMLFDAKWGNDILDYEEIRRFLETEEPDLVFHLAAQAYVAESVMDPRRALSVNLGGTHNLLRALRAVGSQARVLLAGTSEEYGYETQPAETVTEESPCLPTTVYGVSKLAATTLGQVYARQFGMHVVCTRAWNHTGPGQSSRYALSAFARRIAQVEQAGGTVRVGNLDAVRNYTDVRDVVEAYRLLINAEPGIYNVASPYTGKMSWFLDILRDQATCDVPVQPDTSLWRPSHSERFPMPNCSKTENAVMWESRLSMNRTMGDLLQYWRDRT